MGGSRVGLSLCSRDVGAAACGRDCGFPHSRLLNPAGPQHPSCTAAPTEGGKSLAGPPPHLVASKGRGARHLKPSWPTAAQFLRPTGSDMSHQGTTSSHGTSRGLDTVCGASLGLSCRRQSVGITCWDGDVSGIMGQFGGAPAPQGACWPPLTCLPSPGPAAGTEAEAGTQPGTLLQRLPAQRQPDWQRRL